MELKNIMTLRDLIELGGGRIVGRKKMQTIVYIVQEYANPFEPSFEYRWNYYGVYSDELTDELKIGQFFEILEEIPIKENGYTSYAIRAMGQEKLSPIKQNQVLGQLIKFLNNKEARLLEVLSAIIFLKKDNLSNKEINSHLLAYKGHLSEFFSHAYKALEELDKLVKM